jgi:hypothetical protein
MDRAHQIGSLTGAAQEYQNGLLSLGDFLHILNGLLGVLEDQALGDQISESRYALEEIHGVVVTGYGEFDEDARTIVDRAVADIITKARAASELIRSTSPPEE